MKSNGNKHEHRTRAKILKKAKPATNWGIGIIVAVVFIALSMPDCSALESVQLYNPSWTKDGDIDCLYDIEVKFPKDTPAVLVGRFWLAKAATVTGGVMTRAGGALLFVPAKSSRIVGKDTLSKCMTASQYENLLTKHTELRTLLDKGYGFVVVACSGGKMIVAQKAKEETSKQLPKEAALTLDDLAKIIPTRSEVSYQEPASSRRILVNVDKEGQCVEYLVSADGFQSMLTNPRDTRTETKK